MTPEREWQLSKVFKASELVEPDTVLEVGYPKGCESFLDIWGCKVESIDPFVENATYVQRIEDFDQARRYDLVNMSSVLDYLDDPIKGLVVAGLVGKHVLVQGRLNTYKSSRFHTKYWTPTKEWVDEKAATAIGLTHVEWCEFYGDQMFSIFGRTT